MQTNVLTKGAQDGSFAERNLLMMAKKDEGDGRGLVGD